MASLYDLDLDQVRQFVDESGQPAFRADQIWQGLYQQGWTRPEEFSPLPKEFREQLFQRYSGEQLHQEDLRSSADRLTRKFLYRLQDQTAVETVLMEYDQRLTVCVSSQVGCAMGCGFCATGNMGLTRNLSRGEIIEQILKAAQIGRQEDKELTNVVFMGMGEPFHNYDHVLSAARILNSPDGFGMGMRRFTISTVGLVPGILRFAEENTQINLAISLHAADDDLRSRLVPINRKYPLGPLLDACDRYLQRTHRRVTIEWALIEGINDTPTQADQLSKLLRGKLFHVNLIQLNPVDHFSGQPSRDQNAREFQKILVDEGISCTIRLRRGVDIQAGCGQLASKAG